MDDKIWMRAQGIVNCGSMKINTVQELDIEYEIKGLLKKNKEFIETEFLLKKQLTDLYQDRKSYIEVMDALFDCVNKSMSENAEFWGEIKEILIKEDDQFKLDSLNPRQKT
ncbi:hypothetical protein M9Y10_038019 [Tritrichomonas musculus]|uniref:Uncharacterized protein n=1 Tax=Tritrichomonas musculus TaxID=1915356 RepID=A0ABR2K7D4_9EUKA